MINYNLLKIDKLFFVFLYSLQLPKQFEHMIVQVQPCSSPSGSETCFLSKGIISFCQLFSQQEEQSDFN